MTQRRNNASRSRGDDKAAERRHKQHLDEQLDEALKETFPASDPIAVTPRRRVPSRDRAR
jgi:hypothetical protein